MAIRNKDTIRTTLSSTLGEGEDKYTYLLELPSRQHWGRGKTIHVFIRTTLSSTLGEGEDKYMYLRNQECMHAITFI